MRTLTIRVEAETMHALCVELYRALGPDLHEYYGRLVDEIKREEELRRQQREQEWAELVAKNNKGVS